MGRRRQAVFLDFDSLRPADIDTTPLHALPLDWRIHATTSPAQVQSRIAEADVVVCNKVVLSAATLAAAPHLKLVAVTATGTNNVDREAAAALGIAVLNVRGYGTAAVAQHTLALLLALSNRLPQYARAAVDGTWSRSPMFCVLDYPMVDLGGKYLGIIGFGELGQAVGRLASAFGMELLVAEGSEGARAGRLPLAEVLQRADVLSLHCLLSPRTERLINARTLALMKPQALLINTARGGLIDEPALAEALRRGRLGGAALDVLSVEPPPPDHLLLAPDIPNLLITPHCAWASPAARQRLLDLTADNIAAFLDQRSLVS